MVIVHEAQNNVYNHNFFNEVRNYFSALYFSYSIKLDKMVNGQK